MTCEMIDKCLDFAEGKKGKFTILMTKKPEFPENLLTGTDKQCAINAYIEQGYPKTKIAEMMHCTQPNIVEHIRQYRKGRCFYDEWNAFWEFSKGIREIRIDDAFEGLLSEEEIERYKNKNIKNVGDYLRFTVTMKSRDLCAMLGEKNAETKTALFEQIRKMCYELLTVRMNHKENEG